MRRRLGYWPDPPDRADRDLAGLSLPSSDLPVRATLRPYVRAVLDQGAASSCVAHAFAAAIWIAEARSGIVDLALPSRSFLYWNARKQHSDGLIMVDDGTYLRTAARALQKLGAPDESIWPYDTRAWRINRRPSFDAYMRAHARRGGEYRRIFDAGDQRLQHIRAAIAAGLPVTFGTQIAESFTADTGTEIIGPPMAATLGGHAMCVVGYDTTDDSFEVLNSWGASWRDGGFARLTAEYLAWQWTSDLWIVHGWEAMRVPA